MIEPARAALANEIGEAMEFEWNEVRSTSNRSVLAGSGMGITEESTIASAKTPTLPRWINHPSRCDEFAFPEFDISAKALNTDDHNRQ